MFVAQVIPRILPTFTKDKAIKERYDDESYREEVEVMFRQRFAANLEVSSREASSICLHFRLLSQSGILFVPNIDLQYLTIFDPLKIPNRKTNCMGAAA